jgi:ribosome-associated translation inhibitor RaiA
MEAMNTHVRAIGLAEEVEPAYIREKLLKKLRKYRRSIERISVRLTDVNGPRGGADQRCRITVVLSALPSVVIERQHAQVQAAIDTAVHATTEAVRRIVGRRRMKRLHGRSRVVSERQ